MSARNAKSRFQVGQKVRLSLTPDTGWSEYDNELAVIVGPKVYGVWQCATSRDQSMPGKPSEQTGYRYAVRFCVGVRHLEEEHMRPIDDANDVTTWAAFKKATGFRLDKRPATTKPRRRKTHAVDERSAA